MNDQDFDVGRYIIPKSDQINSDDLIPGPRTVTIRHVRESGNSEQPVEVFFEEEQHPYRPCKSMMRVLVHGWGRRASDWKGRGLTIYRDPTVRWGNAEVGGIRISHMSDLPGELGRGFLLSLTKSKGAKGMYEVRPLRTAGKAAPSEPETRAQDEAPTLPPEIHDKAELAARQGTTTFRAWWKSDEAKAHRAALTKNLPDYQAVAAEADAKGAPDQADPFGDGEPRERQPGEEG